MKVKDFMKEYEEYCKAINKLPDSQTSEEYDAKQTVQFYARKYFDYIKNCEINVEDGDE